MSDMMPAPEPWAPIQHEEAAPEPEPKTIQVAAHTRTIRRPASKSEAEPWAAVLHEQMQEEPERQQGRLPGLTARGGGDEPTALAPPLPSAELPSPSHPAPVPFQVGLSLMVPPEVLSTLDALRDAQDGIADQIGEMGATSERTVALAAQMIAEGLGHLSTGVTAITEAMQTQQAAILTAMQRQDEQAKQHADQLRQQSEALAAVIERTTGWMASVEKAVLAPRRVSLTRDADGKPIGAVSETTTPE